MRSLGRNKQTFYYALYAGKSEIIDEFGNNTGQYISAYTEPTEYRANISPARGTSDLEQFGINSNYTKVIVTSDMDCPFDEATRLWIGIDPTQSYNYVVVQRAESLNSISFAIREVTTSD